MNNSHIQVPCNKPAKACYLSASACFILLAVLLLFSQDAFTEHYFQPKLLAITHLAALGWGTLLIFGVCCQALPAIFKIPFFNLQPVGIALALFLSGLMLLVYSFWRFLPALPMQLGSLLLFSGILIFTVGVFLAAKKSTENTIRQEYITTAFVWLTVTALLGVLLVFNFRFAFLPKDHLDFLRIHAHAGIAGWFLMLIIGLSMDTHPVDTALGNKLLSGIYYSVNSALLLFLADTYFSGINLKTYGILLVGFAGLAAYLVFLYISFRRKKAAVFQVLSGLLLMLAVAVIPFIIHYHLKGEASAIRLSLLYGALVFMGWITASVLGITTRYFAWRNRTNRLLVSVFIFFCISFFSGLFFENKTLLVLGSVCLILLACSYLSGVWFGLKQGEGEQKMEESR